MRTGADQRGCQVSAPTVQDGGIHQPGRPDVTRLGIMGTDDHPGKLPSQEEVVQALLEAGWLLEQDTETTLKNHSFHTTPGKAYIDPDERKTSREIDVTGYRRFYNSEALRYSIAARVIVECKQSTMPYVLIGRPQSAYERTRSRKEEHFIYNDIQTGHVSLDDGSLQLQMEGARKYLCLNDIESAPWNDKFVATQMTRLERKKTWQANNQGIFTSLIFPLAKALDNFRRQRPKVPSGNPLNAPETRGLKPIKSPGEVTFYFPLVVTSATLFTLDATKEERKPSISPWAQMTRDIQTLNVRGKFNVDIVNYDHLDSYLQWRIISFMQTVVEIAESDPQKFITWRDYRYEGS